MTHEENNIQLKSNVNRKVFSYIGLAMKSGNLVSGEFATEKAIKTKSAYLILLAEDASKNTKKKFTNKSTYYKIPLYFFGEKGELGKAIGKNIRTSMGILDRGLADGIIKQLDNRYNSDMSGSTIELQNGGSKYGENASIWNSKRS